MLPIGALQQSVQVSVDLPEGGAAPSHGLQASTASA